METADRVSEFGTGLVLLTILAGRKPMIVPRDEALAIFAAFEAAHGPLLELQAAGKFWGGGGVLSAKTGEQIARLGTLLRLPPESPEVEAAAAEIRSLAEQCLQALAPDILAAA
ncbi:MAG: hypothetical protein U0359_38940 [Byssovorax sp.]